MAEQVNSLKTAIKYKDTPIGKMPVDWKVTSLGEITSFEYGESLPERKRSSGDTKVYGSNGIIGYHNKSIVDSSGLIIGRKGSVGAVTWAENNFWPIDTTYYISSKQTKENLKWLFYLLSSLHLEKLNVATDVPVLNREIAYSEIVPIPPISEQKKIADILTTVDQVIEKTTQIINKNKEVKKGLMQKLLTRGINHKKFKKTEIGENPDEWEGGEISDYGKIVTGNAPLTNLQKNYGDKYPNVPILNKGNFSTIKVAKLPVTEQKKIGDILSSIDEEIEKEINHKEQLELLKKGLMQVLLTGKIRVKI